MYYFDFSLREYNQLMNAVIRGNYQCIPLNEFKPNEPETSGKTVLLRHDVDRKPKNALLMGRMEKDLGIRASYYFRIVNESFDEEIISEIARMGHEIGYHYEDLTLAHGDETRALESFKTNLEKFRTIYPVKTMCMHGSPLSRWDNRDLWKKFDYKNYNISIEPYFDLDFDNVLYITDASRRWDGSNVTVRDKVKSRYSYVFRSTRDIIHALDNEKLPIRIMINIHPHNWAKNPVEWIATSTFQSSKNLIKRFLVKKG